MCSFKEAVFGIVKKLRVYDDEIINHDSKVANVIKVMLAEELVSTSEILAKIDLKLREVGRGSYQQHINITGYTLDPDHTFSPRCFAYAIFVGELSDKEKAKIKYSTESETEFVQAHLPQDLPEQLFTKLITVK